MNLIKRLDIKFDVYQSPPDLTGTQRKKVINTRSKTGNDFAFENS